ncbi:Na+/H+ antiporter subunit E [Devosia honganensis]|uniref:Na+/H+ antiporter subunit E n=1 Tax=Devosia honganensis TaxID=1610527 RepID=A0ABV7X5G0_9HYPH
MRRLFPHPILAFLLLVMWLTLNQSAGLGHILLGSLFAILASLGASAVIPEPVPFKRPLKFAQLVVVAGIDIIMSNLAVLGVLLQRRPAPKSGFVEIDLELTNTFGLAILAGIVTATPGSAWLEHSRANNTVIIHVFDDDDLEGWARTLKSRYETLLMEIFQ